MIQKNKVVTLNYRLFEDNKDGKKIEETYGNQPLKFIYGIGMMLPKFEEHLLNLKINDKFSFTLAPEDAYGIYDEKAIVELEKKMFEIEGKVGDDLLVVGNVIPMQDNNGNRLDGIVLELNGDKVKMDFNHMMAGKTLFFEGEIAELRDASDEEINHGHVH